MVNKKGFLRIIEASLAIVIIMGILFVYTVRETSGAQDPDWSQKAREILEEASRNPTIRGDILSYPPGQVPPSLDMFVEERVPVFLKYEVRVCNMNEVCGMRDYVPGNIYVGERVFGASIERHSPKKVRVFIWQ